MLVLNLFFFFAHPELTIVFLCTVSHLKVFRSVGLMGADSLPPFAQAFYANLAIVTLDFEFGKPGCGSTGSGFLSYVLVNSILLLASLAPTLVIMPIMMLANVC